MSDYIWSPHGVNLTWTTSVPTTGLLFLPVTLLGGPVLSYNLLALLAPALSAWTAFLLALLMTTVTLVVLSLGPWLHFGGAWTGVPLPWLAVSRLPLIRLALPTRFTLGDIILAKPNHMM